MRDAKMDEVESLDMSGLTLDERKELLVWYVTEFKKIQIKAEMENMIERQKLLEEVEQSHPEIFEEEEEFEEEYLPDPKINIKISGHPSAREPGYAQISGMLKDITDETLEKFVNTIKEAKKSVIERSKISND